MRSHDARVAKRWRNISLGIFLALLGLALAGLPESQAQYWAFRKAIPPRENDPERILLDMLQGTQQPSFSRTPSENNTPDNDLFYYPEQSYYPAQSFSSRSYYPGGGPQRPMPSPAGPSPYDISPDDLPWNQAGFDGYNEAPQMAQDVALGEPKKYLLAATPLPQASSGERPFAVLIAYLPNHAVFWVEETRTRSAGQTRYFQSPPLRPDRKYTYRVRAAWLEDGRWVSQTRLVQVEAGLIQAIYLRPTSSASAKTAMKALSK